MQKKLEVISEKRKCEISGKEETLKKFIKWIKDYPRFINFDEERGIIEFDKDTYFSTAHIQAQRLGLNVCFK